MRIFLQHGAGLGDLVVDALHRDLGEVDTLYRDDSSVVVELATPQPDAVARLPYASNTFEVLDWTRRTALPGAISRLVAEVREHRTLAGSGRRDATFRTMISIDGELVGLPVRVREQLEGVIAEQTGGRVHARGGASTEFWVIGRRDLDRLLLCRRLSSGGRKGLARASLGPDLATLLVSASSPHEDDVFLDPFGGSGAIVTARLALPLRRAIYSDLNRRDQPEGQLRPLVRSPLTQVLDEDALELPSVDDGSVSAIVTDPPWGEYERLDRPYPEFARAMLASFDRVLDPHGRLVLLLGRRIADDVADVWDASPLQLNGGHDILVNGHPAAVMIGGR